MVFYFVSQSKFFSARYKFIYILVDSSVILYMGKDKYQNQTLIANAWPQDIWFHVKSMSSAHVYLRPKSVIKNFSDLNKQIIMECAELVKQNSIQGCKKATVLVNYTAASNLLKTDDMEVGAVSFKNSKIVYTIQAGKNKEGLKQLNTTRKELFPDLQKEKVQRLQRDIKKAKEQRKQQLKKLKEVEKQIQRQLKQKQQAIAYLQDQAEMTTNKDNEEGELQDDFW